MTPRQYIYINIFLSSFSLTAMETISPKEAQAIKLIKNYYRKDPILLPITKELSFTHDMLKKNFFPAEINDIILQYTALLRNKDFENRTDPFVIEWRDFRIPTHYHYLLKPKQISLLQKFFMSAPKRAHSPEKGAELFYELESKKDYNSFLTLPKELRNCLGLMPQSEINLISGFYQQNQPISPNSLININQHKTIQVKSLVANIIVPDNSEFIGSKPKPILPKEKKNHKK